MKMSKNKIYRALFDSCDFSNLPQFSISSTELRKNLGEHTYNAWVEKAGGVNELLSHLMALVEKALETFNAKQLNDLRNFSKLKDKAHST